MPIFRKREYRIEGVLLSLLALGPVDAALAQAAHTVLPLNASLIMSDQRTAPADAIAAAIVTLMHSRSNPPDTYYGWRQLDAIASIQWNPLPPAKFDAPSSTNPGFQRGGTAAFANRTMQVVASGTQTFVTTVYFKNSGEPVGDQAVLSSLRAAGLDTQRVRCSRFPDPLTPAWYLLAGTSKWPAILWISPARSVGAIEEFTLLLNDELPALSAKEQNSYTDNC